MAKTLFDHLKQITEVQNPKYWETLDESDKKTWSNFMIHRFLSMNYDFMETIAAYQPYTQLLEPEQLYLAYIGLLPKGRSYSRYIKGKKDGKYEQFLVDLVKLEYQSSIREAEDYCELLYATKEGREQIKYICEKYGVDPKDITKLKLKLK
jgi:hypothetical protein